MLMSRLVMVVAAAVAAVIVPTPARADQPIVVGHQGEIASKVLGEMRAVQVRLPADYARTERRYPVLYLTDGERQFGHTAATVEFLARTGRIPEMIVIGVSNNTNRTRDLTPTHVGGEERLAASGGADRFLAFIETELVPWVAAQYRTEPFRVFAGHSFGGLFALHTFLSRPTLFNAVIAVSPTLTWDDNLPIRRAREFVERQSGQLKRTLVMTIGDEPDLARGYQALKSILGSTPIAGFRYELERMPEDDHGSLVLMTHYLGLRRIFDGWAMSRGHTRLSDVTRHYAKLSQRLDWTVKPPEAVVNILGYRAIAEKRLSDGLELLAYNVKTHPESANTYDSYGEGLEADGRLSEAIEQYSGAVEIGERTSDPNLEVFRQHLKAARSAGTR
jgi:predicted alpha/beta superfamily hydrolase